MDQEKTELNNLCRNLWLRGALDKPEEFERVRDVLMRNCYDHVGRMKFGELLSLVRAMHWVGPFCREEPLVSLYEQAIGKLGTLAAYAAGQLREFECVYSQLAAVRAMFESSARRREGIGFAPWPHSEIKLNVIRVLADSKTQDAEADRDRLYSPEELLELYELLYSRITTFMEERQISGDEARTNWDNLAVTGCQLVKMCARFTPQNLIEQIQRFNKRFGANIAMGVGHFRNSRALGGVWYWDFEIVKLYLSGELNIEELDYCHERHLKAAMAEAPDATIFHQALKTEYFWLAKEARRRRKRGKDEPGLEVISG